MLRETARAEAGELFVRDLVRGARRRARGEPLFPAQHAIQDRAQEDERRERGRGDVERTPVERRIDRRFDVLDVGRVRLAREDARDRDEGLVGRRLRELLARAFKLCPPELLWRGVWLAR